MSGGTIAPETPKSSLTLLRLFADHPRAFWRHDVDVDLRAAVKMAQVAQNAGISSTFYLNPRSDFYNLLSREGEYTLETIHNAGHDLGLHCDLALRRDVEIAVTDDWALLAPDSPDYFPGHPIASFHIPDQRVLWRDFGMFENAYASKWEGRYRSDSRGVLPDLSDVGDGEGWQINLHPEWWDL